MSERWTMNRLGFINFWLYDDVCFPLNQGKLFLRGNNGSGKSITTQSIIPFILDGNRSPERLDPFGSRDRKMDYYFLGDDGEKEASTGYMYLEFKKGDVYRTIGIGQQARKGRPMDFWGFLIKDNRRVGVDLELCSRRGDQKIPFTQKQLQNALGPDNIVVDKQQDYMDLVNRSLFDFRERGDYDQLIKLLIKVRAPKLSKDFKPTEVYRILNDSLPTLTDDDLFTIASSMESLDEYRLKLDSLEKALKDAQTLAAVYDQYNRFVLTQKALAWKDAREAQKKETAVQADREKQMAQNREEQDRIEKRRGFLEQAIENQTHALDLIDTSDFKLWEMNLKENKKLILEEEGMIQNETQALKDKQKTFNEKYDQTEDAKQTRRYLADALHHGDSEYGDANAILQYQGRPDIEGIVAGTTDPASVNTLRRQVESQVSAIGKGLTAIQEWTESRDRLDEQEKRAEDQGIKTENARQQKEEAWDMSERNRDALIEDYQGQPLRYLPLDEKRRQAIVSILLDYADMSDYKALREIVDAAKNEKQEALFQEWAIYEKTRNDSKLDWEKVGRELERLKKEPLAVPPRAEETEAARVALAGASISSQPFYEVLEFSEETSPEERALLEAQITDLGFLDTLVVSLEDRVRAKAVLGNHSDRLIFPEDRENTATAVSGHGDQRFLKGEVQPELSAMVDEILCAMGPSEGCRIQLSPDGFYRHGSMAGHSLPCQEEGYIGLKARKKRQEALIADKQHEVDELAERMARCERILKENEEYQEGLRKEYEALPDTNDLDTALNLHREATREWEHEHMLLAQEKGELGKCRVRENDQRKIMQKICSPYPYAQNKEAYEEAAAAAQSAVEVLETLYKDAGDYKEQWRLIGQLEELQESLETDMDRINQRIVDARRRKKELETKNVNLQERLNSPEIKEKAQKARELSEAIQRDTNEKEALTGEDSRLKSEFGHLERDFDAAAAKIRELMRLAEKKKVYYLEERALGLVADMEAETEEALLIRCVQASKTEDLSVSYAEWSARISESFSRYGSLLTEYMLRMETRFSPDAEAMRERRWIGARIDGQHMDFMTFTNRLKEMVEETRIILKKEDEKLFKDMMSDTLCRKLTNRIGESRKFIKKMSELMRKMDTSMGLAFDLDWRPNRETDGTELSTKDLERLLTIDQTLLQEQDQKRVTDHFRHRLDQARQKAEEQGDVVNYADLIRETLDYRTWFEFRMNIYREGQPKKELTNSAFNRLSGGEKAMAMYVPLFAAVNAQYAKASREDHPRMIALDEAFAGVDDKNIGMMFKLVETLDFDYIMNSQALWGCYAAVPALHIAELICPVGQDLVVVIHYTWNGKERRLDG